MITKREDIRSPILKKIFLETVRQYMIRKTTVIEKVARYPERLIVIKIKLWHASARRKKKIITGLFAFSFFRKRIFDKIAARQKHKKTQL